MGGVKRFYAFVAATGRIPKADYDDLVGCSNTYFSEHMAEWWDETPGKLAGEESLSAMEAIEAALAGETVDYASLLNPGVEETLDALLAREVRVAVASSTAPDGIRRALGECGVYDRFEAVLSGEDFAQSKPAPDIYLAACARLGLEPAVCVAVEDSNRGIAAARAAGLRVAVKREERFGFSQEGGTWYIDQIPDLLPIVDAEG